MQRRPTALARALPFFYGWWVVIAAFIIILIAGSAPLYLFSVLVERLEEEFGWSRATIGAGPSLGAVVGGLTLPLAGYLADRVGVRRLVVAGVLLVGGGNLALSQVQTLWQFYASVLVIAIGMSMAGVPVCLIAAAHWFEKKRGRAMGIVTMGAGASGIMVVLAVSVIAPLGWHTGTLIVGVTQLAIGFPLALTVRNRPQEMGLLPDGEPPALAQASADPPQAVEEESGDKGIEQPEGLAIGETLRTRPFWLLVSAMVLAWVGSFAVIVHVVAYLDESAGFTERGAAVIAMGIPFGSMVGRLAFGWLADYLSKRWLLTAAWTLQALGLLIFAVVHSPWQAVVFLAVFTPGFGGAIPVMPALLTEYFGLRAFGTIQGLVMAAAMLGAFTGPIFAGAAYDMMDTYRLAFLILALITLTAAVLVQMMGRPLAWAREVAVAPRG